MAETVIAYGREQTSADFSDGALWIPTEHLERATGWALKPEGVCRDEACVPIPRGRESEFSSNGRFNLLAFANYMDQPVVHEPAATAWVIGEGSEQRHSRLRSAEAPDFELPDIDGDRYRLSDYRGRKVLIVTWGSW